MVTLQTVKRQYTNKINDHMNVCTVHTVFSYLELPEQIKKIGNNMQIDRKGALFK